MRSKYFNPSERLHMGRVKVMLALARFAPKSAMQSKETKKSNGWHGQKRMWSLKKLDEVGALNITLQRLANERYR